VQEEPRLATCKQPLRDDTKRKAPLFMEFLLYLLVVIESDALTSLYNKAYPTYRGILSCLEALVSKLYVIASA
jgi:hypothetical protein